MVLDNLIDPDRVYFKHILHRDSFLQIEGRYVKDIARLSKDRTID